MGFGGLAARMAVGMAGDWLSQSLGLAGQAAGASALEAVKNGGPLPTASSFLNRAAAERLTEGLCRMRGAALKLGQMLSLQDEETLGPEVAAIMEKVRTQANVMPRWQLEQVLASQLGDDWLERLGGPWRDPAAQSAASESGSSTSASRDAGGIRDFSQTLQWAPAGESGTSAAATASSSSGEGMVGMVGFDPHPIAAASIGQVHRAVLADGRRVAVKVQYPGVASSIDSDIDNATALLRLGLGAALPPGLYLDQAVTVAREELRRECDYTYEARQQERFRAELAKAILHDETPGPGAPHGAFARSLLRNVHVPAVVPECSSERVLTTEWLDGVPVDKVFATASQAVRDSIARRMLRVTLWELFEARLMQTDPNWGNFFYDAESDVVGLLDFGASREFEPEFVDEYLRLVWAAAQNNEDAIVEVSARMGFLTGMETPTMVRAHLDAGLVVGEPFLSTTDIYDFRAARITARVAKHAAVFAEHRLAPPPDEIYSLHRKLSGAFLLCIRMGARIPCRDLLEHTFNTHEFTTPPLEGLSAAEALRRRAEGTLPTVQRRHGDPIALRGADGFVATLRA